MRIRIRSVSVLLLLIASCVSIIVAFSSTLFESPVAYGVNVGGQRITSLQVSPFPAFEVDIPVEGANYTWMISLDFFHYYYDFTITLPYGFASQHVSVKYNHNDVPCREFESTMKLGQVFSLLSIFACFFAILFVTALMFTRLMLPFVWIFGWTCVIFNCIALAMLLKVFFDGFCLDDPVMRIPPGIQYSMPSGGVALYILSACMLSVGMIISSLL